MASPVTEVAAQTRAAIIAALAQFTGYTTTRVNVTVGHLEPSARVAASVANGPVDFHAAIPVVSPTRIVHPTTRSSSTNVRGFDPDQWVGKQQVHSVEAPRPTSVRSVEAPSAKEIRPSGEITKHVEEIAVPEFTSREIQLKDIEVATKHIV